MEATEFELLRQRKHLAALSNYQTNSLIFAGSVVAIILVAISGIALQLERAERRRAERSLWSSRERFRLMIEGVEDYAIFLLDPEGRVITWNAGAERINGYEADEILAGTFPVCLSKKMSFRRATARTRKCRERRTLPEGWRLRKDGSKFWVNSIISPIRDEAGDLVGFTKITRDFTKEKRLRQALEKEMAERRDAQQELAASEKSLRRLSLHLLRAQDEERRRIGRDLHDSVAEILSVLMMKLEALMSSEKTGGKAEMQKELRQCSGLAEESIKEVRTISYLLYPPMLEEIGLKAAMPWYLEGFSKRSGIKATFEISDGFGRVPSEVEMALFRVLQESLTNIHKHSGSSTADIRLSRTTDEVVLEVTDKGKGMPGGTLEEFGQVSTGALGVGLEG